MTIQSVWMARFRTEVQATRNVYPPSLRSNAARWGGFFDPPGREVHVSPACEPPLPVQEALAVPQQDHLISCTGGYPPLPRELPS